MLSFAGRVTLTRSVIQALPSYVMQSAYIPRVICDEIDKRCRKFIWGDTDNHRNIHMVSWSNIRKPKSCGDLGLREARLINQTSMMRINWDLTMKRDDLWVQVVWSKYGCGNDTLPNINLTKAGSNLWKGICNAWEDF